MQIRTFRQKFLSSAFPQVCCQHVQCLFSMGYNTTAAACPCSHPVRTRPVSRHFHTISHHFSTYNQQFYQNICCFLLSFHKIDISFLSCYVRLPKNLAENGSQKGFTIFPPDAMLFENDPENQSTNRKDIWCCCETVQCVQQRRRFPAHRIYKRLRAQQSVRDAATLSPGLPQCVSFLLPSQ